MKIIHLDASDTTWSLYHKKRIEIVELYNKSSKYHRERTRLNKAELSDRNLLHVFYKEGVKGGVLVEQLLNQPTLAVITFAAIDSKHQRSGLCTSLIKEAEAKLSTLNCQLVAVQINSHDNTAFWKSRGFSDLVGTHNGAMLFKPDFK